jgi:hypothetical protein
VSGKPVRSAAESLRYGGWKKTFTFVTSVGGFRTSTFTIGADGSPASAPRSAGLLDRIDVLTSGAQAFLVELRAKRRPHHTVRAVSFGFICELPQCLRGRHAPDRDRL